MCGMRVFGKVVIAMVVAVTVGVARAGEITISFHEAGGSGSANLFDGGPPRSDSGSLSGATASGFLFAAIDRTRPGSLGASAGALGSSQIFDLLDEDGIRVYVSLDTSYRPSLFGGGDNPGGMAEGSVSSVIEFIMPTEELLWAYQLRIRDSEFFFEGSTSVLFENVTQSRTLLELTTQVFPSVKTTLFGNIGDVMRITTLMSGSGSAPPGSSKEYNPTLSMTFIIPEPATLLLLALGAVRRTARKRLRGH